MRRIILFLVAAAVLAAGAYVHLAGAPTPPAWLAGLAGPRPPAAAPAPPAAPPPEVGVVEVRPGEVALPVEYAGRVIGFRDVEVRPRVGGVLLRREFEEGARVKEGQVLFRLDPATYEVAQARAEAQVAQAQAAFRQAEENFRRIEELIRRAVATEKQRDDAQGARDQAQAALQGAQAELRNTQLNLSYTTVTAPASGVTALQSPAIGSLIQAQQTLLTTITQLDPAYVSFSFTDEEGQAFREMNQRRARPISEKDLTVELRIGRGEPYPRPGTIDTAAQRVDPQTGTIQARAVFPNPDGALLPGQFVRVTVRGISLPDALVIPEQAVNQGPQGPSVFVVGENNTAQARPIRLGRQVEAGWVVEQGLKAGERVVAEGLIRVRPGAPVRPVPIAPPPQQKPAGNDPPAAERTSSVDPAKREAGTKPEPGAKPGAKHEPSRAETRGRPDGNGNRGRSAGGREP